MRPGSAGRVLTKADMRKAQPRLSPPRDLELVRNINNSYQNSAEESGKPFRSAPNSD